MEQEDGYQISKILLIIGGIIALVLGATRIAQIGFNGLVTTTFGLYSSLFLLAVGIISLVSVNWVKSQTTAIVLAVLGFIAGGVGGILVAIGGIVSILSKHTLKELSSKNSA